jgi:hypothetical protein
MRVCYKLSSCNSPAGVTVLLQLCVAAAFPCFITPYLSSSDVMHQDDIWRMRKNTPHQLGLTAALCYCQPASIAEPGTLLLHPTCSKQHQHISNMLL